MCKGLASLPATCLERAKRLKACVCHLLHRPHLQIPMRAADKPSGLTLEEVLRWRESLEALLKNKYGIAAFTAFLVSEYSEENIAFYLACEEYRSTSSPHLQRVKAQEILQEFVRSDSPREVNLDHETRVATERSVALASPACFALAQSRIYTLMEKDCYPRFLRSPSYLQLAGLL